VPPTLTPPQLVQQFLEAAQSLGTSVFLVYSYAGIRGPTTSVEINGGVAEKRALIDALQASAQVALDAAGKALHSTKDGCKLCRLVTPWEELTPGERTVHASASFTVITAAMAVQRQAQAQAPKVD
jgi:hypothetical protein